MKYKNYVQDVLDYIEENMTNNVDLEEVSKFAGFSRYHFHRIFKSYTGYSVSEYTRMRRFLSALGYLRSSGLRLLEISVECGFESQESFTRAFKKQFNVTPGKMRKDSELIERHLDCLKCIIDAAAHGKITGGGTMKPEIIFKEEFYVVGLRYFGNNQNGEIPELWDEFNKRYDEIENKVSGGCIGLCEHVENFDPDSSKFEYVCCCEVSKTTAIPDGMVLRKVPAQKFARFVHKGPVDSLGETYDKIFGEYLPGHNLHTAVAADFEYYGDEFESGSENSIMYVYIPIK